MNRREFLKKLGKVVAVAPVLAVAPSLLKGETKYEHKTVSMAYHIEKEDYDGGLVPLKREGETIVIDPERSGHGILTRAQFQKDMQQSLNKVFDDIYKTDWHRRVKKIWDE